ncbi:MAG: diaminopimelate decarboxylase [Betaproteobacteria bacterium]
MSFSRKNGTLHIEEASLSEVANEFGTPSFVYSRESIEEAFSKYQKAFGNQRHLICYAVKANSNIAILHLLAKMGSGFDVVSGGELKRVLLAGGDPKKTVFSGVGKTAQEIKDALSANIKCFNIESESELERISHIAKLEGKSANISLRVNPDVDAKTHPYISTGLKENKFGVDIKDAINIYRRAKDLPNLNVAGIDCHIGSQLVDIAPMRDAAIKVVELADALEKIDIHIHHIDFGGGLGIRYQNETPAAQQELVEVLLDVVGTREYEILIEPGRSIVGNSGVLLTRVEYVKLGRDKNFLIVDAAMNDLARPALYDAHHEIVNVIENKTQKTHAFDVVGPICETGDFLGKNRSLSAEEGDMLAIMSAGAYGMTMSSNYNTRPKAAEILVNGSKCEVIRDRETIEDLTAREKIPS